MDQLARHVDQAHRDVEEVQTSARKLTGRFAKIVQVQLDGGEVERLEAAVDGAATHDP